jgi:hypothetical protein
MQSALWRTIWTMCADMLVAARSQLQLTRLTRCASMLGNRHATAGGDERAVSGCAVGGSGMEFALCGVPYVTKPKVRGGAARPEAAVSNDVVATCSAPTEPSRGCGWMVKWQAAERCVPVWVAVTMLRTGRRIVAWRCLLLGLLSGGDSGKQLV